MKTREQIAIECALVYRTIQDIMILQDTYHIQSWWLNSKNCRQLRHLTRNEIKSRLKKLVKNGSLLVDKKFTSTSMGTNYKLSDKNFYKMYNIKEFTLY